MANIGCPSEGFAPKVHAQLHSRSADMGRLEPLSWLAREQIAGGISLIASLNDA